jgi:ABC-type transport system involved in cytochrome c biogenesis ATPase subunit
MTLSARGQAWLAHQRGEKYTPPKRTPEQIREDWKQAIWNAQRGIRGAKLMLDKANSIEERKTATEALEWWQRVLETAKKELGEP